MPLRDHVQIFKIYSNILLPWEGAAFMPLVSHKCNTTPYLNMPPA